jgi:hypothetical protein
MLVVKNAMATALKDVNIAAFNPVCITSVFWEIIFFPSTLSQKIILLHLDSKMLEFVGQFLRAATRPFVKI